MEIMKELELKYGCNPNQKPSRIYMEEGELPIKVLNGKPCQHLLFTVFSPESVNFETYSFNFIFLNLKSV